MAAPDGEDSCVEGDAGPAAAAPKGMTKCKTDLQCQAALMDMAGQGVHLSYGPTDMKEDGAGSQADHPGNY